MKGEKKHVSVTRWRRELRLVLIGNTGSGKSASGNTILGCTKFLSKLSAQSVTKICEMGSAKLSDGEGGRRRIKVVDMPGFGDTHLTAEQIHAEIAKCVSLSAPGPHAFLLVVPLGRYIENENEAVCKLARIFGEDAVRLHTVVLFTRGDDLEGMQIEAYLKETAPAGLQALIDRCGGRYHILNNRDHGNRAQVEELIMKVDQMVEQNNRGFYTNTLFQKAEAAIREEQQRMLMERGQAEGEEQGRQGSALRSFLSKLRMEAMLSPKVLQRIKIMVAAGVTGMVVGAAFGALVPLAAAAGASLSGNCIGFVAGHLAGCTGVGGATGAFVAAASGKISVTLGVVAGGLVGGSVGVVAGAEAASPREGAIEALSQVSLIGASAVGLSAGVGCTLGAGAAVAMALKGAAASGTVAASSASVATASGTVATASGTVATASSTVATASSTVAASSASVATASGTVATASSTVAASSASVATASGTVATASSTVATSSGTVATASASVATASGTVAASSGTVATASSTVATASSTVAASSASVATASGTVATASSTVATASGTVATASASVATASGTVATASASVATASGTVATASASVATASGKVVATIGTMSIL